MEIIYTIFNYKAFRPHEVVEIEEIKRKKNKRLQLKIDQKTLGEY